VAWCWNEQRFSVSHKRAFYEVVLLNPALDVPQGLVAMGPMNKETCLWGIMANVSVAVDELKRNSPTR